MGREIHAKKEMDGSIKEIWSFQLNNQLGSSAYRQNNCNIHGWWWVKIWWPCVGKIPFKNHSWSHFNGIVSSVEFTNKQLNFVGINENGKWFKLSVSGKAVKCFDINSL